MNSLTTEANKAIASANVDTQRADLCYDTFQIKLEKVIGNSIQTSFSWSQFGFWLFTPKADVVSIL